MVAGEASATCEFVVNVDLHEAQKIGENFGVVDAASKTDDRHHNSMPQLHDSRQLCDHTHVSK